MAKMKVQKGDKVLVLAGKDAGKSGVVTKAFPQDEAVIVEKINLVTKHKKPKDAQDKGGIEKREAPINVSNVQVICPTCGKATRIEIAIVDGKKVRKCKKCSAVIGTNNTKKVVKEKVAKTTKKEKVEKVEKVEEVSEGVNDGK